MEVFGEKKLRIGLLGGTFDPPHRGHVEISEDALSRFKFDAVLWLVTKGNPLKQNKPSDIHHRLQMCYHMLDKEQKIFPIYIDDLVGSSYTVDLISFLRERTKNEYIWIMGSDNLESFHKWYKWRDIENKIKMIIYNRPGYKCEKDNNLEENIEKFLLKDAPASFLVKDVSFDISSSQIRNKNGS